MERSNQIAMKARFLGRYPSALNPVDERSNRYDEDTSVLVGVDHCESKYRMAVGSFRSGLLRMCPHCLKKNVSLGFTATSQKGSHSMVTVAAMSPGSLKLSPHQGPFPFRPIGKRRCVDRGRTLATSGPGPHYSPSSSSCSHHRIISAGRTGVPSLQSPRNLPCAVSPRTQSRLAW